MLKIIKNIENWSKENTSNLLMFNTILVFMVLMRSAGYFLPYFELTINVIVIIMLVLSIFLLRSNSKSLFVVAFLFWLFASLMKVLKVDIWAERTAIYTFESLLIGTILLIIESLKKNDKN